MPTIWDTEAGMMLMADELKAIGNSKVAQKIILLLYQRPHTHAELIPLANSSALRMAIERLTEQDIIQKVELTYRKKGPPGTRTAPRRAKYYFLCDHYLGAALHEVIDFEYRKLRALTAQFAHVSGSLDCNRGIRYGPLAIKINWNYVRSQLDSKRRR